MHSARGFDWSPDGRWVAYISATSTDAAETSGPVTVGPVEGGSGRRLFEPSASEPAADDCLWSADSRTVYFKSHDAQGRASFWSVSAEGGRPRLLVKFDDPQFQSARKDFAMDARRFYFAVEDRQSDVFVTEVLER